MDRFERNVEMGLLLDTYGAFLTDRQAEIMDLFYNQDMSQSEIGEQMGISRQAVHDSLQRSVAPLTEMEDRFDVLRVSREMPRRLQALAVRVQMLPVPPEAYPARAAVVDDILTIGPLPMASSEKQEHDEEDGI
jgi:predicted DNA-binding protein YlxM (UPF0122 family)